MKLLYVIEHISTIGGLERILIEKMNALAAEDGFEVVLMTVWQDNRKPAFPLNEGVRQVCLDIIQPQSTLGMLIAMPKVIRAYNRQVCVISPDVVIHFRAVGALLVAFSSWHGKTVFEAHTARQYSNHRWLYPMMERKADVVVCLTRQDARNYSSSKRVEVIPNFSSLNCLESSKSSGLNTKRCLFVGRLCPEKNPLRVLRLWRDIVARHPDWTLDIYGAGELEYYVRTAIVEFGIQNKVEMHGNISDIKTAYAQGSILLLASRTEGFPMTIIEAMQCGVPVVSTDCPCGPSDIILDGENGFLVPEEDDSAFVSAVCKLISDYSLREKMGRRAVETSARFGRETIIQRWKDFFSKI